MYHEMKCVAIPDRYLYCLNYCAYDARQTRTEFKFSVCTSFDGQSERILKCPPLNEPQFRIYEMQDSVLFQTGIFRDYFYLYNKELDKWFPLPQIMKQCWRRSLVAVSNDTHLLYAIGGLEKKRS